MNYTLARIFIFTAVLSASVYLGAKLIMAAPSAPEQRNEPQLSIVKVLNPEGTGGGTGFVVKTRKGKKVIVTNDHVCEVAQNNYAVIQGPDGKLSIKPIISRSAIRDLCLLEGVDLPALPLGEKAPYQFEPLHVVGHPSLEPVTRSYGEYVSDTLIPFGLETEGGKCKNGELRQTLFGDICVVTMELSLTTVPVYPGNSGSPIFNSNNEVIGVINSTRQGFRGMFVPLIYLKAILAQ